MLLCEAWNWFQPNGAPRDMVCRGLMLALHRAGHIRLPARRFAPPNPLTVRARPAPISVDATPLHATLHRLGAVRFCQVRRVKRQESLFNALIEQYHYLGYTQPVGEHLKYLVYAGDRPVACLAFSSAPRHLGPRDRFIGWDGATRRGNIHLIAYNTRFLVLPWIRVPHLASHILGRVARRIGADWNELYGHPVWFLETFVDPPRFRGTCYRAANWISLGRTTGRGKDDRTNKANRPLKELLGYPLTRRFRSFLGAVK